MNEKPKTFFAVSSEEATKEGRLPLALFEFREEAEKYRDHALATGIITEWMIDRNQTEANLTAVAMRIVTDRLKVPGLLKALNLAAAYVGRGIVEGAYNNCAVSGEKALETIELAISKAEDRP